MPKKQANLEVFWTDARLCRACCVGKTLMLLELILPFGGD